MKSRLMAAAAACVLALALAACGGGGGGGTGSSSPPPASPPPPPPPPPPANTAPEVRVTVSSTSPDEGQPFWIDTSGSSDGDGDTLTVTVTQISGPAPSNVPLYEDIPSGDGIFAFRAPEVDEDAVMAFEISVSDGEHTVTETASVTATNIVLEPEVDLFGDTLANFEGLINPTGASFYSELDPLHGVDDPNMDYATGLIGVSDAADGSGRVLFRFPGGYPDQTFGAQEQTPLPASVPGQPVFISDIYQFALSGSAPQGAMPLVGIESLNKVFVISKAKDNLSDPDLHLSVRQGHDIEAPCAAENVYAYDQFKRHLVVGTRGNGLQIFRQLPLDDPNAAKTAYEPSEVLAASGTFCTISTGENYIGAYEAETGRVRTWTFDGDVFVEQPAISIDLPENAPPLVAADLKQYSTTGFVLGLVMSDGKHDGKHELHVYYTDATGTHHVTHSWTKGVPAGIEFMQPNANWASLFPDGFIVPLETAPYALYVNGFGGSSSSPYADVGYVPTGLWVSSIRGGYAPDLYSGAAVLTQTRVGTVKMVELTP